jgi:IS1 family transposase
VYREQATFHTDSCDAYTGVIPEERHQAMTKKARKSHHLERFNNALRSRASRLVREPLSPPKQLAYHIGAMQYVMCYDNLTRATAAA